VVHEKGSAQDSISKERSTHRDGAATSIDDLDSHETLADGLAPADHAVQHSVVAQRHTESEEPTPPAELRERFEEVESEAGAHQAKQQAVKEEGEETPPESTDDLLRGRLVREKRCVGIKNRSVP
jgi:hypothetical protein